MDNLENKAFYTGKSMLREFTPGDLLETREIPFAEFRVGDVVAFRVPEPNAKGVVHRVIARGEDYLVTMGDNNMTPDAHRVVAADNPRLVVSRSPREGVVKRVWRGKAGRCVWWWHRLRKFIHRAFSAVWRRTFAKL